MLTLSEKVKKSYQEWWQGKNEKPLIYIAIPKTNKITSNWNIWEIVHNLDKPDEVINQFEKYCDELYFAGVGFSNFWINLGPGIVSAYLGAEVEIREDTVWFNAEKSWDELLNLKYDPENKWWILTKKIVKLAVERSKGKYIVSMPDLGGTTDILAQLRGTQRLLFDLVENPEEVKKVSTIITDLWIRYYKELYEIVKDANEGATSAWMDILSSGRWYPVQCDFSAMIGPKMFKEFVFPYLQSQCRWLDNTIYHLDGPNEIPHLDILLNIPELNGIQWIPGDGNLPIYSKKWFPLYKRIQDAGKNLVLLGVDIARVRDLINELSPKGLYISTRGLSTQGIYVSSDITNIKELEDL